MNNLLVKAMIAEACSAYPFRIFCNSVVNQVNRLSNDDEVNVWHSCLCYINFRSIARLYTLCLIPKMPIVKGSKLINCSTLCLIVRAKRDPVASC